MRRILIPILLLSLMMPLALVGCSGDSDTAEPAVESTDPAPAATTPAETETDPDKALVESKCSLCHTTDRVWGASYDRDTWATTLDRMKTNGMVITDEEYEQILTYLSGL